MPAFDTPGPIVMDWLVAGLKVVGAVVALLSVAQRPRPVSPAVVTMAVWAAFATLAVYALGSVAEAAGMGLGLIGGADRIDAASVGYVLFFLAAAAGYGVLATSYSRRHPHGKGLAILGVIGAPAVLGFATASHSRATGRLRTAAWPLTSSASASTVPFNAVLPGNRATLTQQARRHRSSQRPQPGWTASWPNTTQHRTE